MRCARSLVRGLASRLLLKGAIGGLAIAAILVWLAVAALPDGRLHVSFLDVNQGDATYIETAAGQQILIDGGASPASLLSHIGQRLPFTDRTLDLVVLSDDRQGHLDGLLPVLERYSVKYALYAPETCTRSACARWKELLNDRDITVLPAVAGMTLDLADGVRVIVLQSGGRAPE